MEPLRIAVLLTCHDRREATLRCLRSLAAQQVDAELTAVLVDADSRDGTAEAVSEQHPWVRVVPASAEVFWNAGMRLAWERAWEEEPAYFLWLNDDVVLDRDAVARLLGWAGRLEREEGRPVILAGTTRDPETAEVTYGAVRRPQRWSPLDFSVVAPGDRPRRAASMNGNCVLVPRDVAARVGTLDPAFVHRMGDFDYGLRASAAGFGVWAAPGTVGSCSRNPRVSRTVSEEIERLKGPKGLPPREWLVFSRRWAGTLWPVYFLSPYVRRVLRRVAEAGARRIKALQQR